jgi:undecaprenyl-diphosphatase
MLGGLAQLSVLEGLILGILQGLTEFLPVSSSGHLVLLQRIFGINEGAMTFDIAVHVATLAAVILVFRKELWEIILKPFGRFPLLILTAMVPTVAIGFALKGMFGSAYESGATVGFGFILTGLVLLYAERVRNRQKDISKTTWTDALSIGTAQAIALFPGVSRSGMTITASLSRGLSRELALKFSFLLSIPAILGAAFLDGIEFVRNPEVYTTSIELLPLIVGMTAAAVSGYFAIKFMIKILMKGSLKVFSWYVFALGGLVIIDQLFFGKFFEKLL